MHYWLTYQTDFMSHYVLGFGFLSSIQNVLRKRKKKNEEGFLFFWSLCFERFALSMPSIFCWWNFSLTIFAYRRRSLSQITYILHLLHMIDLFSFYLFFLFAT